MIAFYPQFVPSDSRCSDHRGARAAAVCIELCFYLTLAAFVARAGAWFRRSTVRRRLEAVSGTVLVGSGAAGSRLRRADRVAVRQPVGPVERAVVVVHAARR